MFASPCTRCSGSGSSRILETDQVTRLIQSELKVSGFSATDS